MKMGPYKVRPLVSKPKRGRNEPPGDNQGLFIAKPTCCYYSFINYVTFNYKCMLGYTFATHNRAAEVCPHRQQASIVNVYFNVASVI